MIAEGRRLALVAVLAAVFGLVHEICARVVAAHDLLGSLLNRLDPVVLLLGVVLAFTRATLFFLLPGWLAYRIASLLWAKRSSTAR